MSKKINELVPQAAIHPGEILLDELKARGYTQKQFAKLIEMQPTQLNEIINGKRSIKPDLAVVLENVLDIDASIWINLQAKFDLDIYRIKLKKNGDTTVERSFDQVAQLIPVT